MDHRIEKIEALMQNLLAELIAKDFITTREIIISITKVKASGNLQEAKVYVSVLPDQFREQTVDKLSRNAWSLQASLNKKLRMRPVPKIIFVADAQPEKAQQVETLLEKLKRSENH
jgi:ribosome-binding factor A